MLVSDMLAEVRDHGFDDLTDSRILSFLNDSYYDVCSREPWPFLEVQVTPTISAVTGLVSSPTDVNAVQNFVDTTNGISLFPVRVDDLYDQFADTLTATGNAKYYYFVGDSLYVYPIPSGNTYKLVYLKRVAALTSSPDSSPIFSSLHHRVLVTGALARASVMEDDPDLAAVHTNAYETRINQMRTDLWKKQYDEPDNIQDVFWGDDSDWIY